MKIGISKRVERDWQRRWQNVHKAELDELRHTPRSVKYRQFATLASGAGVFGKAGSRAEEIAAVRARWRILRKKALHD